MVIVEINRQPATDLESARRLLDSGQNMLFVYALNRFKYVAVVLP
jgi:hypothetical protein